MIGSTFKTETIDGVTVKYPREWARGFIRPVVRADGPPLGKVTRALVAGGHRYTYSSGHDTHKTFTEALRAIVRGAA